LYDYITWFCAVGDQIIFVDYARKWGTNAITINQNSLNFQGYSSPNPVYNTNGQSVSIVYSGATKGWIPTVDDDVTNEVPQAYSVDFLVIAGGGGGVDPQSSGSGMAEEVELEDIEILIILKVQAEEVLLKVH
jgi:hypothetical protein